MDDYHISYFSTSLANCIAFMNVTFAVGKKFLYLDFRINRFDVTGNKESNFIRVYHIKCLLLIQEVYQKKSVIFRELSLH